MRFAAAILLLLSVCLQSEAALRTPRAATAATGKAMATTSLPSGSQPTISIIPQAATAVVAGRINLGDGGSVTLAWDGSMDLSVVGYRIWWGSKSGSYTNSAAVGDVRMATIGGLTEGSTYYFAATAYDKDGVESVFSNVVSVSIPFRVYSGIAAMNFYGIGKAGATNVLEWSTNNINWNPAIVWKGNGKTTNLVWWMTNAPQAFIRIRAK